MSSVPTIKCEDSCPSPCATAASGPGGAGGAEGEAEGAGGSYNLSVNVNLSSAMLSLLTAEGAAVATLRTPEIVNDVITMTNPLDHLEHYTPYDNTSTFKPGSGNDSNSSMSNGSSATSPSSSNTPSIQKTCSELIKAGLKLSIESKRKMSGSDTDVGIKRMKREDSDDDYDSSNTTHTRSDGLTAEDEERRRRRRERNKIAATKCRMKKRERTVNLVTESEVLEHQNVDLKAQLKELEVQKRQLVDMLSVHSASCVKHGGGGGGGSGRGSPQGSYAVRSYDSPASFPVSYEAHSPYLRPESANILASSYSCVGPLPPDAMSSFESSALYVAPTLADAEFGRPASALAGGDPGGYVSTDGYLPRSTNLLIPIDNEQEYFDPEAGFLPGAQQCHGYQAAVPDAQARHGGVDDGCLA